MQVRDTPLRVNERANTVVLSVGAGGSGVYYGPSESTVTTNTAAPGAQVTLTSPMYVKSQGGRDGPPADIDVLGGDAVPSSSPGSGSAPPAGASDWINVTATPYSADTTGAADATAAIQAAIDACPQGGTVYLPTGTYRLTASLVIAKPMTLRGAGCYSLHGSQNDNFKSIDVPMLSPYLTGSVLRMDTAATDALRLTGAGQAVHLHDFGIRFADATKFSNTGHGIVATPPAYSTRLDNGLSGAQWGNVQVYGHDGNHYAFYVRNGIYNTFDHLRSFGGGALYLEQNSTVGKYGNFDCRHLYGQVFDAGSAHGVHMNSVDGQSMTTVRFSKTQITVQNIGTAVPEATAPTSAQKTFNCPTNVNGLSLDCVDLETNVGSAPVFPGGGKLSIDPGSLINNPPTNMPWAIAGNGGDANVHRVIDQNLQIRLSAAEPNGYIANLFVDADGTSQYGIKSDGKKTLTVPATAAIQTGRGATGARPTPANAGAGAVFFDTTLGKPIWVNAAANGWVDSTGTAV